MSEYCKNCQRLSDELASMTADRDTVAALGAFKLQRRVRELQEERDRLAEQLADMYRVPANAWRCACGLVVKRRYACLSCGGIEQTHSVDPPDEVLS